MKNKKVTQEGIKDVWTNVKSAVKNAALDFTGTPQQIAARNTRIGMIQALEQAVQRQIQAGYIDPSLPPIPPRNTTPTPTPESRFQQLNAIFESIMGEAGRPPGQTKQSLYQFLVQYTASLFKDSNGNSNITKKEFSNIKDNLISLHNNWNNAGKKQQLMGEWADKVLALSSRRGIANQNPKARSTQTTGVSTADPASTSSNNPQENYTEQLIKQIGQMSKDYIDDMPRVVTALMAQIKKIDSSVYNRVLMQLGSKDAKFAMHDPMREDINVTSTPKANPKSLKKLDDAMKGVSGGKRISRTP